MCLTVDKNISKKFDENGNFVAYKVFVKGKELLSPLHQRRIINGSNAVRLKGEYYVSNRASAKKSRSDCIIWGGRKTIGKGIHVILGRNNARAYARNEGAYARVVPVLCNMKDLVAFGYQNTATNGFMPQAVFLKVKIISKKHQKMCLQMPRKKK